MTTAEKKSQAAFVAYCAARNLIPGLGYGTGEIPVMVRVPGRKTCDRYEVTRASWEAYRATLAK